MLSLGAYQGRSILYFVGSRSTVTGPLHLRTYVDTRRGPKARAKTAILGDISFQPKSRRLTVFDKARGFGDCGIYSVFRLRGTHSSR